MKPTARASALGSRGIYETLREQIEGGVYGSSGLLPSSRSLADELQVSRTTVTVAYEQLAAEGFITVRQGARPRVAKSLVSENRVPQRKAVPAAIRFSVYGDKLSAIAEDLRGERKDYIVDFRYGDIASADFPVLAWKKAVMAAITQRPGRLAYGDPRGLPRLRDALKSYLWRARSIQCSTDQIIVVNGSQQGLDLCARILLQHGDRYVFEDPGYAMARHAFSATGAEAVSVPVDEHGMQTESLQSIKAKLAYVTPSHQFPIGSVMPVTRRQQLLSWAKQSGAIIVEDDYDSEFRYDISPIPPLYSLEGYDNVIYVGTISKTLSPTLRIGYLVVPNFLRNVFVAAKQVSDRHTASLEQEALASFIETGAYESHVRRVRRQNGERRQTLLNALNHTFGKSIRIIGADAGLHIVVRFSDLPGSLEQRLIEMAGSAGVGVRPLTPLYNAGAVEQPAACAGIVMGYAALDTRKMERGVQLLAQAVDNLKRVLDNTGPLPCAKSGSVCSST